MKNNFRSKSELDIKIEKLNYLIYRYLIIITILAN